MNTGVKILLGFFAFIFLFLVALTVYNLMYPVNKSNLPVRETLPGNASNTGGSINF